MNNINKLGQDQPEEPFKEPNKPNEPDAPKPPDEPDPYPVTDPLPDQTPEPFPTPPEPIPEYPPDVVF